MTPFARLLRLTAPFRWWMVLSALLGFLTIGSSIGLMSTSAWIIATAALHPSIAELQVAIVGVRFFGIARGAFRYLERYVSHQTTFRLLARLRVWFYEGLEPLAPARLMSYHSGDLLGRAVADISTLENFYLRVIAPSLVALMTTAVMGLFFAAYDLRLALALLGFLLVGGVGVPFLVRHLSRQVGRDLVTTRSILNVKLVDGIQGSADLVAYGRQADHVAQVQALSRELVLDQTRFARIGGLQTALISLIIALAVITVLVIAIPLVHNGQINGVMLAVLVLATISCFEAIQPLPLAFQHLESNLEAARRLFELIDTPPAVLDPGESPREGLETVPYKNHSTRSYDLVVSDLHFCYAPGDPPALDGISFTLPQGNTLAIVGASGAGKSTLVNLLLRFWDIDQGQITLGGSDLRAYDQEAVRSLIGVVAQNTYLFNATIRENLQLARPGISEEELIHAAQIAQLHERITALPDGYDTWIGEMGYRLSGGERQRLAIARALLKNAPILILDEPTANLDPVTESELMGALRAVMVGRTTLIITHRLVGLESADEILVLQAGRIVERGRHHELQQIDGIYRRMWEINELL
jgi:thiol reductant ABC exporter CydC subunit